MKKLNKLQTKYDTLLGVVFSHRINPDNGEECWLDLNDPTLKDRFIRWEMKLTNKRIHEYKTT
jgi:hypothetical protein